MPRYRLDIEYDGTLYYGWQRQAGFMTVQQAIEEACFQFARHEVTLFGAGRTDTGVHALGQVGHVDLDADWQAKKVAEALNGILKLREHRIAILNCHRVDTQFDARFSARKRLYRYRIINRWANLTVDLNRAWHVKKPLDAEAMHEAAQALVGHHDFTTFRSINCQAKSPMKTLEVLDVRRCGTHEVEIMAASRSFLHNQVRSMVGSLKLVGEGKWTKADIISARDALDRKACGPVAPPCGLYLMQVDY
ncbi:MAG: tRNA pseudouridine(38-40) synthase TruA [Rhizobiaceae bacterium]